MSTSSALKYRETYRPVLSPSDTEDALRLTREVFGRELALTLNLREIPAPLFVEEGTGVNDYLNGVERPVSFSVKGFGRRRMEVIQSLAKWKRLALAERRVRPGEGIVTVTSAIGPGEELDALHSAFVDQWDWERVIAPEERTLDTLVRTARMVYRVLRRTEMFLERRYPELGSTLPPEPTFLHAEELALAQPGLLPSQREDWAVREYGAVFVIGIGAPLSEGKPHGGRAPDCDDWITDNGESRGLNGDLLVWHPVLRRAVEITSMGIRVDAVSLLRQLRIRKCTERGALPFHRRLIDGDLPQTIGGGIGRSRACMFLLRKAHIGEVQPSVWTDEERQRCERRGIALMN